MSYCINPWCTHRENSPRRDRCQTCDTPLLLRDRYRLLQPLRTPDPWDATDIFEVSDRGCRKVLKVLKNPALLGAFKREAETLMQLSHPGIPKVDSDGYFLFEHWEGRPLHCLVMEKIQGINLAAWLQDHGPIDQATAIKWMHQLAEILAQLHRSELFHRDIKPSNIMLRTNQQLALVDFGNVRPMTSTYFAKVAGQRDITSVVSPGYTPLEQINGKAVPQSDFYALGRSVVHLLTGQHPADLPEDETTGHLEWQENAAQPIDSWLVQLLDDLMAPFPGQRPLDAEAIVARLNRQQSRSVQVNPKLTLRCLAVTNAALLLLQIWVGWRWVSARQQLGERAEAIPALATPPFPAVPGPWQA